MLRRSLSVQQKKVSDQRKDSSGARRKDVMRRRGGNVNRHKEGESRTIQKKENDRVARLRDQIIALWSDIPDKCKGPTIAVLLDKTDHFHQWDTHQQQVLDWLRFQFEDAGVKCLGLRK